MKAKIYVVILNWNGYQDTIECLESLYLTTGVEFVAVVCDNASGDQSVAHIERWAANNLQAHEWRSLDRAASERVAIEACKMVLIETGGNWGFAGGNNVGVRFALRDPACSHVWLLNNDTVVAADALAQVLTRMQQDQRIGLCGSTLIYYHERDKVQAYGGAIYSKFRGSSRHVGAFAPSSPLPTTPSGVEAMLTYVVGAAMLVRREFLEQVGLMREDYFLYYEEIDWATRGRGRFAMGYAPSSLVYHKEGASIGTQASGGSALSVFYLYRNRLRFTWRFYPIYLPSVLAFCAWEILKFAIRRRWTQMQAALRGVLQLKWR